MDLKKRLGWHLPWWVIVIALTLSNTLWGLSENSVVNYGSSAVVDRNVNEIK